ncbi:hypothetical protein ACLK1S_04655 [Escherichia coli]
MNHPHRRYNRFTGQSIIVSPHRANALAGGAETPSRTGVTSGAIQICFLCAGNVRVTAMDPPGLTFSLMTLRP